jgi:IMP dehydrogenase/GMP reductase
MMLMFNWKDVKNRGKGLTFDDVLIVPARSDIRSRRDPKLTTKVTRNFTIDTPVISANMDIRTCRNNQNVVKGQTLAAVFYIFPVKHEHHGASPRLETH